MSQNPLDDNAILKYLREQEDTGGEESFRPPTESPSRQFIREFLEELLHKVHRGVLWRERFRQMRNDHNQHCMFDLLEFMPDVIMDDDLIKKLLFKEQVIICSQDPIPNLYPQIGVENAVGTLCVDIRLSDGKLIKEPIPDCDTFEKELLTYCQQIKDAISGLTEKMSAHDETLVNEVSALEELLNKEIESKRNKFIVFVYSKFNYGPCQYEAGSEIMTWVNRYMHTLEEKRREFVYEDDVLNQKTCYCGIQRGRYYLRHTSTLDGIEERKYHSMAKMKTYISEGANLVIMRLMILTKFIGTFEMTSLYINGDLCRNIYESKGPRIIIYQGKRVEAYKIYRVIIEKCGMVHRCSTIFSHHGRIISQEWEGNQYTLKFNPNYDIFSPLLPFVDYDTLTSSWTQDLELLSKYMDQKTKAELTMKTYMSNHPEIKDVIADYMQHLLQLKPNRILDFTCEYFKRHVPFKEQLSYDPFEDIPFYLDM